MKAPELKKLMEKVGCKVPKKASEEEMKKKLTAFLEDEGLPEDLTLTDEEKKVIEELGFEVTTQEDESGDESNDDGEDGETENSDEEESGDEDGETEDEPEEDSDEDEDDSKSKKSKDKKADKSKKSKDKKEKSSEKSKKPAEKPDKKAGPKKSKSGRRELMAKVISEFLRGSKSGRSMDEIKAHVLKHPEFSATSPSTIYTFVCDGKNPTYSAFNPLLTRDPKTGNYMIGK